MKFPPFNGSPSHHSPLRTKLPLLTNPTGADGAHCSSKIPIPLTASNGSVTVAPGARSGKSNSRLGVPFEKESEFRFVDTNQSLVLSFFREYPQPTIEPAGPKTLPLEGNRVKVMESAQRGDAKQNTAVANKMDCKKCRVFISCLCFLRDDRLSHRIVVRISRAILEVAALGHGESCYRGRDNQGQGHGY